jgi:3-deoxy-D-manno-octulosonate 8-phosphate phosphatase (KDO 8-P phosphatase)
MGEDMEVTLHELTLHERCRKIEMLVMDVDGVLTDGAIIYSDRGEELKAFHVRDGSGLKLWLKAGKKAALLTGRKSPVVERRAKELGIGALIQGADDKGKAFANLLATHGLREEQAAYVGDDWPDLPVLRRCGLACTVADACAEAKQLAHYVTIALGGRGAVREIIEVMLRVQGRWEEVIR